MNVMDLLVMVREAEDDIKLETSVLIAAKSSNNDEVVLKCEKTIKERKEFLKELLSTNVTLG